MEEQKCVRHPLWLPIVVVLIAGGAYIAGKKIEMYGPPATIHVSGEGKVTVVPDIAELSFGVQTGRMKTAEQATKTLSEKMNAALEAVQALGIEEKDIRTESLRLNPAFDWDEGERIPKGFEASQSLRVKIRDLDKVGSILTAATAAGANQAGGVSFTIDDPEVHREQARKEAIENAQEKARKLAEDLGLTLGKLKGYDEGGGGYPGPIYMERAMMVDSKGGGFEPPPVPAGEQEVRVNVNLTYEVR